MWGQESLVANDEEKCMEVWDRRRRTAVVQVLCYVVCDISLHHIYYQRQDNDESTSSRGEKRKHSACDREFEKISEAISTVAHGIREGTLRHVRIQREKFLQN
ncbi:hypothetical protein HS088_TW14G00985 [Tripterygium wilfordii]|uniref:Uncharacterized protein n=2 Tax=Tripterygium wilfordii TaxID=458696 RepID=A0A7J7CRW6_TRIWF|nr:hypothetical protein HS088_TW14G00985 [Tripterygium wilfordii]